MSMEIFVSCLGDLATLVGSVLFVTSAGHPLVLFFSLSLSLSFFFLRDLGEWKVSLWQFPCILAELSF